MTGAAFLVHGTASPGLPLRILNLFAQQDVLVDSAEIALADGDYRLRIAVRDLPHPRALVIVEKMRAMVLVKGAELGIAASADPIVHPAGTETSNRACAAL